MPGRREDRCRDPSDIAGIDERRARATRGNEDLVVLPDARGEGGGEVLREEVRPQERVGGTGPAQVRLDVVVRRLPIGLNPLQRGTRRAGRRGREPGPGRGRDGSARPRWPVAASGRRGRRPPGRGRAAPAPSRSRTVGQRRRPGGVRRPAAQAAMTLSPRARRLSTTDDPTVPVAPVTRTALMRSPRCGREGRRGRRCHGRRGDRTSARAGRRRPPRTWQRDHGPRR